MKVSTGKNKSVLGIISKGSAGNVARKAAVFLKRITGKENDDGEDRLGPETFPF